MSNTSTCPLCGAAPVLLDPNARSAVKSRWECGTFHYKGGRLVSHCQAETKDDKIKRLSLELAAMYEHLRLSRESSLVRRINQMACEIAKDYPGIATEPPYVQLCAIEQCYQGAMSALKWWQEGNKPHQPVSDSYWDEVADRMFQPSDQK